MIEESVAARTLRLWDRQKELNQSIASYPAAYGIADFDGLLDETPSETPSPEECAVAEEMQRKIIAALEPRELRVFLCMLVGYSESEMAAIEEVSTRQIRRIVAGVRVKARAAL